jgi:hypothetical protein
MNKIILYNDSRKGFERIAVRTSDLVSYCNELIEVSSLIQSFLITSHLKTIFLELNDIFDRIAAAGGAAERKPREVHIVIFATFLIHVAGFNTISLQRH